MEVAMREAEVAFEEGEVPIGAVLVRRGAIIAAAHNRVEALQDASAHAELLCARAAAAAEKTWRLSESTLYCTVEPCPMCLAALHAFRIERLVYGTINPRLGAVESAMRSSSDASHPYHALNITGGVLSRRASELMKAFFRRRRDQGPRYDVKNMAALPGHGHEKPSAAPVTIDACDGVVGDGPDLW